MLSQKKTQLFCGGGRHSVACHITSIETHQRFFRWKLSPRHGSCGNKFFAIHIMQGRVKFIRIYPYQKGLVSFIFFLDLVFWTGMWCVFFCVFFLGGNDERNMSFVELNCVHTSPFNEPRDLNKRIGVGRPWPLRWRPSPPSAEAVFPRVWRLPKLSTNQDPLLLGSCHFQWLNSSNPLICAY